MGLCGLLARVEGEAVTILCASCWAPVVGVSEFPATCSFCGAGRWLSVPNLGEEPKKVYKLSENDRRLLRSFRIEPEV